MNFWNGKTQLAVAILAWMAGKIKSSEGG